MAGLLVEVVLDEWCLEDCDGPGVVGVRDALDEALAAADLGEVAGTYRGTGHYIVDVELDGEERVSEAVGLVRRVLRGLGLPGDAEFRRWVDPIWDDTPALPALVPVPALTLVGLHAGPPLGQGRAAS
jgi:hypothetical protein